MGYPPNSAARSYDNRLGRARRSGRISRRQIKNSCPKLSHRCYDFLHAMLGIQSSTFEKSFGDRSNTCMNLVACSYEQLLSRSHVVSHLWRFRQRSRLPGEMLRFSADKVEEFGSEFREIVQDSVNTLCEACCLLF